MKKIYFLVLFIGFVFAGFGQILTFDFNGLAGDEVSANSNSNDANLSYSTITRGSGLTATSNGDRFNATNWALENIANAISGNNYMEFTITPQSGSQFSISSIYLQMYRSTTGPRGIVLRSSIDSYASNLDQEYPIVDITNKQTFTFSFTQVNSSVPVTYRVYMWAEQTGGSGGIGDAAGNDLRIFGLTSITPGLWKTDAATTDWATGTNWDDGNVPTAVTNVVIPVGASNYPTISAAANCNDLTIKSDATGDASLIGQGNLTIAGTVTIERYVSGYASGEPGWHFLSSPVQNLSIAASDFLPGSGVDDFYQWDEVTNTWLNYFDSGVDPTFDEGKGYLIAYSVEDTKTFTGSLNTATETENLSYTENGEVYGDGWNLLGNPYPSAIDWDLLGKSVSIFGSVYAVKASDGTYISYNGSDGDLTGGVIPPHQGFFVQAEAASQTVTIETGDQVHPNHAFYKSEEVIDETLKVSLKGQESENNTYFQFRNDATADFDNHADAYKLFGWATIAQVYSELNDMKYSINCLPHSQETVTVPLGIQLTADEELSLDFSGMDSFFNTVRIDLEDLETGVMTNVRENPSYTFQATTEDHASRFLLHFNGVTAVEELSDENAPQIYTVEDVVYINHAQNLDADIFIYATNGQLVGQDQMSKESMKRVSVNGSTGIYLVTIQTSDAVYTEKVYIK